MGVLLIGLVIALPLLSAAAEPGDVPSSPVDTGKRDLMRSGFGGISETTIHGAVAWASGSDIVHSFGGNVLCYGRSMMKPLTMKVFADILAALGARRAAAPVLIRWAANDCPRRTAA